MGTNNKTIDELWDMACDISTNVDYFTESLRHYLSARLIDTNEEKKMGCNIVMQRGYFGLGELEKPTIIAMWQQPSEGIIWVEIEGMEEPIELDDLPIETLFDIVDALWVVSK